MKMHRKRYNSSKNLKAKFTLKANAIKIIIQEFKYPWLKYLTLDQSTLIIH